ncbi:hypothetical protein HLB15_05995 [Promicromonospora citrea]|uniref:hypothetical protein n=1 Tax=Promicromonospora citrea TaxID=43677 RepID=UPI0014876F58|nr:hypothetical protein [Promicromonospora citrea]NNH51817.1 hypothetical protein [Promicromonospora citrea]
MTRVSRREPAVLTAPAGPAYVPAVPGREHETRRALAEAMVTLLDEQPTHAERHLHELALTRVLDWLETFAGEDWQDRWLHSASDQRGHGWLPDVPTAHRYSLTRGIRILIVLRVIRPSYAWFSASRLLGVYSQFRRHNHAAAFVAIEARTARADAATYGTYALNLLTHIAIATGKSPRDFDMVDFNTYRAATSTDARLRHLV